MASSGHGKSNRITFFWNENAQNSIKEEPEEGELAPTPPPWNFTIHSILTQLTHAPHAVQTEQLPPGETFAGFKMPETLGAPPAQKRKEVSFDSEVRFDSYDSYFGLLGGVPGGG